MGILLNGVERSEIKAGDHIYTYRVVYAYSHHGIYLGESKVIHFTQEQEEASSIATSVNLLSKFSSFNSSGSGLELPSKCPTFPVCGFKQPNSGVVLSCLDCFLGNGSLYLFEYGVTPSVFFAKVRGGTCTMALSDPPDIVTHRAMCLLQKGFGNYVVLQNNCEDFALYCKTGLLTLDKSGGGRSGQVFSFVGAPLAAALVTPLKYLMPAPVRMAVTAGMYCVSRYATDIGVRSDVIKVAVEDMSVTPGWVYRRGKEVAEEEEEEPSNKQVPRNGISMPSIVK